MLQAMWQNFLSLHRPGRPLLMPNPWDAGSAKLLASLGFEALATTSSGFATDTFYDAGLAAGRVAAAAEAAHAGPGELVLTARSENYVHGRFDLADTISRLHSFQEAGADVLFAPGVRELEDIRELVSSVDRPVNVLVMPGMPTVAELADAGVSRISVGGAFAFAALGAAAEAGRELLDKGTYGFWDTAAQGAGAAVGALRGD